MKVVFFGREVIIRKEYVVVGLFIFLMMMTVWGWYLKTNDIEVFDARDEPLKTEVQESFVKGTDDRTEFEPEDTKTQPPDENSMININTADITELVILNGIGEVKARAIIAYRQQNGLFQCIDEIVNVKGIGEVTFQKIKDRITVQYKNESSEPGS